MKLVFYILGIIVFANVVVAYETYQETATTATVEGGLANGSYLLSSNINGNVYDGNWNTAGLGRASNTNASIYVNYSRPIAVNNDIIIQYKVKNASNNTDLTTRNVSLPSTCMNVGNIQILYNFTYYSIFNYPENLNVYCKNSTQWVNISTYAGAQDFYEEAIYWKRNDTALNFTGGNTRSYYYPICTYEGNTLATNNTGVRFFNITNYITCQATSYYLGATYTVPLINGTYNISLSEIEIQLNFSSNTTGNIYWGQPLANGQDIRVYNLTPAIGYNYSNYQYHNSTGIWTIDDTVSFQFNKKNNLTNDTSAQYYEFVNKQNITINEKIGILNTLDKNLWVNVYSYANDLLVGSTVRVMWYQNSTPNSGYLIQQRLTQPYTGEAASGTILWLDNSLTYLITATAEGYTCPIQQVTRAADTDNNLQINMLCKKVVSNEQGQGYILGPQSHNNNTGLVFTASNGDDNTIYYNTDYYSTIRASPTSNKATNIVLYIGTDYNYNENFTLRTYTYNSSSGVFNQVASIRVRYEALEEKDLTAGITQDNRILAGWVFISIILISSILSFLITKEGSDIGYYIFSAGTILAGIIYTTLLPLSIITGLAIIGTLMFNSTRD